LKRLVDFVVTVPEPERRSPSHFASARRIAAIPHSYFLNGEF
jgi:hypothetical protein